MVLRSNLTICDTTENMALTHSREPIVVEDIAAERRKRESMDSLVLVGSKYNVMKSLHVLKTCTTGGGSSDSAGNFERALTFQVKRKAFFFLFYYLFLEDT